MKRIQITYTLLLFALVSIQSFSQSYDCEEEIKKAKDILKNKSPFSNSTTAFNLLKKTEETCNTDEAKNLLGLLYNEGVGTAVNAEKGFELLLDAANNNYVDAQFNIGLAYKYGLGCTLDNEQAIAWFIKASDNGHQKAASTIGYMYFKGFSVIQDYEEAIRWFEKSNSTQATYYLGLSYYLGYGVMVDEAKAIEILTSSDSRICKTLITHINANKKTVVKTTVAIETTNETDDTSQELIEETVTDIILADEIPVLTQNDILGEWTGKYIQYDWSGEQIVKVVPLNISFTGADSKLTVTLVIEGKTINGTGIYRDNTLIFLDDFNFDLDRLYHDEIEKIIGYTLLTIQFDKKIVEDITYVTGSVDSYIKKWEEYGRPSRVVLTSKNNTENEALEDAEFLEGLFDDQEQHFIKLYPVPFDTELSVMYELATDEEVYAELVDVNGGTPLIIQEKAMKPAGSHVYKIPISNVAMGLYVVRLTVGTQIYTRLVTKEN